MQHQGVKISTQRKVVNINNIQHFIANSFLVDVAKNVRIKKGFEIKRRKWHGCPVQITHFVGYSMGGEGARRVKHRHAYWKR